MFLLISVRHVGAHPDGDQHCGVSIQISINFVKTFLRTSRIRNIPLTWILARVFAYLPPFISQIQDLIYWTVLFILNGVTPKTNNRSDGVACRSDIFEHTPKRYQNLVSLGVSQIHFHPYEVPIQQQQLLYNWSSLVPRPVRAIRVTSGITLTNIKRILSYGL